MYGKCNYEKIKNVFVCKCDALGLSITVIFFYFAQTGDILIHYNICSISGDFFSLTHLPRYYSIHIKQI